MLFLSRLLIHTELREGSEPTAGPSTPGSCSYLWAVRGCVAPVCALSLWLLWGVTGVRGQCSDPGESWTHKRGSVCLPDAGWQSYPCGPSLELPPRSASGYPLLGHHGLRLTEAGKSRGLQPRENLLHFKKITGGNQNGYCVRVLTARLQFRR